MNLVFVDETQARGDNNVFAVCALLINSSKYPTIVGQFGKLLTEVGWSTDQEFKGSFIFSGTKGDTLIQVDQRIKLTDEVLDLCHSQIKLLEEGC